MTKIAKKEDILQRLDKLGQLAWNRFVLPPNSPYYEEYKDRDPLQPLKEKLAENNDLSLEELYDYLKKEDRFFAPGAYSRNLLFDDENEEIKMSEKEFLDFINKKIESLTSAFDEREADELKEVKEWGEFGKEQGELQKAQRKKDNEERLKKIEEDAVLAKQQREERGVISPSSRKKQVKLADLTVEGKMDAELDLVALLTKIKANKPDLLEDFEQNKTNPNKFKLIFPPKPTPSHQLKKDDKDEEVDKVAEKAPSTFCEFERKGNQATFTVQQPPIEMNVLVNIARMSKAMGYNTLKETDLTANYLTGNEEHGFTPNQILTLTAYKLGLSIQDKDGKMIEGDALIDYLEKQLGGSDVKMEALNKLVNESLPANERVKSLEILDDPDHDVISASSPSSGR